MTGPTAWTPEQLAVIDAADELEIASRRASGRLGSERIIWVVRVAGAVYVRSVNGPGSDWFRSTRAVHAGRVSAGGMNREVTFVDRSDSADPELNARIDAAYRSKYGPDGSAVERITSPLASRTTIRLDPA